MDKTWSVYIHISPSFKYYIGITSLKPIKRRWANGKGYSKNIYFSRAINKYGWSNFKHIIYADNLSEKDAKNLEIELIAKYKSNQKEFGYNITSGGEGCAGLTKTQYQIDMIKLASSKPVYQFDMDYNYIKEFPSVREAARQLNIPSKSGIQQCCTGEIQSSYNFIWRYKDDVINPYDKNSIRKSKYKKNILSVYQINVLTKKYVLYPNIRDACNKNKLEYNYIHDCCTGRRKTYKGYLWIYAKDVNIEEFIKDSSNFIIRRNKPVDQYDMNGSFIKSYISASKAGKLLGINRKRIIEACNKNIKSYKGFIWKYHE